MAVHRPRKPLVEETTAVGRLPDLHRFDFSGSRSGLQPTTRQSPGRPPTESLVPRARVRPSAQPDTFSLVSIAPVVLQGQLLIQFKVQTSGVFVAQNSLMAFVVGQQETALISDLVGGQFNPSVRGFNFTYSQYQAMNQGDPMAVLGSATLTPADLVLPPGSSFGTLNKVALPMGPLITVAAMPATNAAGWNDSNVTVTFACQATFNPITGSCPSPVTVSTSTQGQ